MIFKRLHYCISQCFRMYSFDRCFNRRFNLHESLWSILSKFDTRFHNFWISRHEN